jgi:hypothetical protein
MRAESLTDELAADIVSSWGEDPAPADEVVRRYDRNPSMIRDGRLLTPEKAE